MKLRNKKTGEIATVEGFGSTESEIQMTYTIDNDETKLYLYCTSSLATFNEEWCDYEEPKERHYYIEPRGQVIKLEFGDDIDELKEELSEIGNYFETKEEAEKAVEKLKAFKRLEDKGIEFYGWRKNHTGTYDFLARWKGVPPKMCEIIDDLDLLFEGEDD